MSSRIKELVVLLTLVLLIMVYPAWVLAAEAPTGGGFKIDPISTTLSAGDWIISKITAKPKPSYHNPEREAKFNSWIKEDWIKNDPYACLWDPNWIHQTPQPKYKGVC